MILIGLTGSIAMGKSTVAAMFETLGYHVHDADKAVHHLYQTETVIDWFRQNFLESIVDNAISREFLATSLKAEPQKLKLLEHYIHPLVSEIRQAKMQQAKQQGKDIFILDVPLLFETGGQKKVDVVVTVSCGEAEQQKRALARPNMTLEKFMFIKSKQWEDKRKQLNSHVIINTLCSFEETQAQVKSLLKALKGRK